MGYRASQKSRRGHDKSEKLGGIGGKRANGGCGIAGVGTVKQEKNEIMEQGKDRARVTTADQAGVFTERHVASPVQDFLDVPMLADVVTRTSFCHCKTFL